MKRRDEQPDLASAARAEIRRTLHLAFPEGSNLAHADFAESACSIAEAYDVPIEELKVWIHFTPAGEKFTLQAWRASCAEYKRRREEVARLTGNRGGEA